MGGQILLVMIEQTALEMMSQMKREKGCVIASLRYSLLLPTHELGMLSLSSAPATKPALPQGEASWKGQWAANANKHLLHGTTSVLHSNGLRAKAYNQPVLVPSSPPLHRQWCQWFYLPACLPESYRLELHWNTAAIITGGKEKHIKTCFLNVFLPLDASS